MEVPNRRPIKTRSAPWAAAAAGALARKGITPNLVSVISVFFALAGAGAMVASRYSDDVGVEVLFVTAAVCIQLRLVCNLLDGMIAMEHGLKSKVGDLFNEIPDRIADPVFLLGAGYASGSECGLTLAWVAAILAVGTAYIRVLGGSLGVKQDFCGPFAKQQRMFFLTLTLLAAAVETLTTGTAWVLPAGLAVIAAGTAVTVVRRSVRLARELQAR